jgi:hypothetical protein
MPRPEEDAVLRGLSSSAVTGFCLAFFGLTLFGLAACARYSTSSGLVGGIRSVAIPLAENDTPEERIADLLSEATTDGFAEDGRLRVVDEGSADALLSLQLRRVVDRPFTYTAAEQTEQYRIQLFVSAVLTKIGGDKVLLELDDLSGWGTYEAESPDEDGRDPAIQAALDMIIEEIVDRMTATW